MLFVAGEKDNVTRGATEQMLRGMMGRVVPDLRGVKLLPNAGHWVQQDLPEQTNAAIIEFRASLK